MKHRAKQIIKHPLIYGSGIVIIGGLIANFFNFLFNLFMSRNLSIADYGILASIISLIGFPALLASAISPMVVQFAGSYFAQGRLDMVRGLYKKFFIAFFSMGLLVFLLLLLNLHVVGSFLHVTNDLMLLLVCIMIFVMTLGVINGAFIQAKLAFSFQVFANIISSLVKFILGVVFINFGLSAIGAVYSLVISIIVAYVLNFIQLRFIFDRKIITPKIETKELFQYGIPSTLTLVSLTSFISTDIILVKHFFDPTQAGIYAGLSLVARVIFFISAPIASVMFPIIVRKHAKQQSVTNTFLASLFLVTMPSLFITFFYFLFPEFSLTFFLKKTEYLQVSSLLGIFALYISLYSMLFIICNFYLSIKRTKIYIPVLIGAILQILFISLYHTNYMEIIVISLVITFLLVLGLLLYYPHATKTIYKD